MVWILIEMHGGQIEPVYISLCSNPFSSVKITTQK